MLKPSMVDRDSAMFGCVVNTPDAKHMLVRALDGSPKGSLANTELRTWRKKAHAAFDPLWQSGKMNRTQAYQWLALPMEIPAKLTHIAMFDIDCCQQVVKLMHKFKNETSVNV